MILDEYEVDIINFYKEVNRNNLIINGLQNTYSNDVDLNDALVDFGAGKLKMNIHVADF